MQTMMFSCIEKIAYCHSCYFWLINKKYKSILKGKYSYNRRILKINTFDGEFIALLVIKAKMVIEGKFNMERFSDFLKKTVCSLKL